MNLEALKVFGTIIDQGSISAAAAALAVSRATVAKRLDEPY